MEFFAAYAPWAVFNINRKPDAEFMWPLDFMLRRRARLMLDDQPLADDAPLPRHERPARLLAPVPPQGRCAIKGERPPSRFGPGQSDCVIERFDAYATAYRAGRVRKHGR